MPVLKERTYAIEEQFFSPYATKSKDTKGRSREEKPCEMRTDFQRDRDRIIYCKAFRRLKNKTQVFFSPEGDHYITRLTHTLDVAQIARSLARALALNEDLAEATALGHDLGHTPFGHSGERILNKLAPCGFKHNVQSVRVVDVLEKDGMGLNLTWEVRDGILNHQKSGSPATLEGRCVRIADKVAYINHDLDDAVRAGVLKPSDVPNDITDVLGKSSKERINTAITSVWRESYGKNSVAMGKEVEQASEALRAFMFERVYLTEYARGEEEKAERMLSCMYEYFMKNADKLPEMFVKLLNSYPVEQVVCDYINHDLDDAVRAGVLKPSDVPNDITDVLGKSSKERINTAITSVWRESYGKNSVAMGKEVEQASEALRAFMFERVYLTEYARGEEEKAERMLSCMYEYFMKNADKLPEMFVKLLNSYPVEQVVCDYISSMTDRYAIYTFNKIFVPRGWTFVDETSFK